jgi:hypothetical protein
MQRAERVLVLTSPAFDFATTRLPSNVRYVAPVIDDLSWAEAPPAVKAAGTGATPLVVVVSVQGVRLEGNNLGAGWPAQKAVIASTR